MFNFLRTTSCFLTLTLSLNAWADLPEETINKAHRDLNEKNYSSFVAKKGFSFHEAKKEDLRIENIGYQDFGGLWKRVFVIGETPDGTQMSNFAWGGLWTSHKELQVHACEAAKATNWRKCILYAKDNEIVFIPSDELLDKADGLFKQGKDKEAGEIIEDVGSRGFNLIPKETRGKFYYLNGLKGVKDNTVSWALDNFETSWRQYSYIDAAKSELELLATQDSSQNWKKIRDTYDFIEAYSRVKNKDNSLNLNKYSELYNSTNIFYTKEQSREADEERITFDQNKPKRELVEMEAKERTVIAEKEAKERTVIAEKEAKERAQVEARESKRLAVQQKIEQMKAEKEAKRLAEEQRQAELKALIEAKKSSEQLRLANIKAEREAQAQEKRRLAEDERKVRLGDGSSDDLTCKSFGAKPGTETYINCRLRLAEKSQQQAQQLEQNRRIQAEQQRFEQNKRAEAETEKRRQEQRQYLQDRERERQQAIYAEQREHEQEDREAQRELKAAEILMRWASPPTPQTSTHTYITPNGVRVCNTTGDVTTCGP